MNDTSYCSICNYGMAKVCIEQARFDYPCPNCKRQTISMFYSIGSDTHKKQLARTVADAGAERDYTTIQPPAWPE